LLCKTGCAASMPGPHFRTFEGVFALLTLN
jgi:hypothetical protein